MNVSTRTEIFNDDSVEEFIEDNKTIIVDELFETEVGGCGLWQWMVVLLLAFSTSSPITFSVFANSSPQYRCRLDNNIELSIKLGNFSFNKIASLIGPWNENNFNFGCEQYKLNWSIDLIRHLDKNQSYVSNLFQIPTEPCSNGYVFDQNSLNYPGNIVQEFIILCNHSWLIPLESSLYFVGMICGFIFGGICSDKFGRRQTILALSFIDAIANICTSLSPNYTTYVLSRFWTGLGNSGKVSVCNIMAVEMTVARYRSGFTATLQFGLNFFNRSLISLWAYLIPQWRWLNLIISYPTLFSILYYYFLPESPRWLISKKRYTEGLAVLYKGYQINHLYRAKFIPSKLKSLMDIYKTKQDNNEQMMMNRTKSFKHLKTTNNSCNSIKNTIFASLFCFGILTSFFGLLLYARIVWNVLYLVTFFNSLISLPAIVIFYLTYRFAPDRKRSLACITSLCIVCLGGSSLYSIIVRPKKDIVMQVCSNIALGLANVGLCMCFVYIPELYSSEIRNQRFGCILGFARIGAVLSSFINELDMYTVHGLSLGIYSILMFFGLIFLFGIDNNVNVN